MILPPSLSGHNSSLKPSATTLLFVGLGLIEKCIIEDGGKLQG